MKLNRETISKIETNVGVGAQVASAHLSSAQLLSLHSSPVTIVPAPGVNKFIAVQALAVKVIFNTRGYIDPNGTFLFWGTDSSGVNTELGSIGPNGYFTSTTDQFGYASGVFPAPTSDLPARFINQPLVLSTTVANMTNGDGTATIWVHYVVLSV
jgi:hypothetical protein